MSPAFSFTSVSSVFFLFFSWGFPGSSLFQRSNFSTMLNSAQCVLPSRCTIFQGFVFQSSGHFTATDPISSTAKVPHAVIALLAFSDRWLLTPHQSSIKPPTLELQWTFHTTTNNQTAWKRSFPLFSPFFFIWLRCIAADIIELV